MDANGNNALTSVIKFVVLIYKVALVYLDVILSLFRGKIRKNIKGQNVLITGAGHGLGRELAHKLAEEGANLVLVDINKANNEKVKLEIINKFKNQSSRPAVHVFTADIREESKVAELATEVKESVGDIDILINNAGMIKNNKGHIVAISSIAGLIASKYLTDYCASKFAVVGLMEALDKEIHDGDKNQGIHFTTACPVSQVADDIVSAILTNKKMTVIPPVALFFYKLAGFLPTRVAELMQDFMDYGVKPHAK